MEKKFIFISIKMNIKVSQWNFKKEKRNTNFKLLHLFHIKINYNLSREKNFLLHFVVSQPGDISHQGVICLTNFINFAVPRETEKCISFLISLKFNKWKHFQDCDNLINFYISFTGRKLWWKPSMIITVLLIKRSYMAVVKRAYVLTRTNFHWWSILFGGKRWTKSLVTCLHDSLNLS